MKLEKATNPFEPGARKRDLVLYPVYTGAAVTSFLLAGVGETVAEQFNIESLIARTVRRATAAPAEAFVKLFEY